MTIPYMDAMGYVLRDVTGCLIEIVMLISLEPEELHEEQGIRSSRLSDIF